MKKISIAAVLLILLIIIAADLYNDHKRSDDQKNKSGIVTTGPGTSSAIAAGTPTNDEGVIGGSNNNGSSTGAEPATTEVGHRHYRHVKNAAGASSNEENYALETNNPDQDGMVAVIDDNATPSITVESPKEFLGNMPQKKVDTRERRKSNVHFAPEIGYMQNTYYNNKTPDMLRDGLRAGGILDIGLGNHFSLQPGIMYEWKGVEMRNTYSNSLMEVDTKDQIDLNYLEIPLDLVVKFGDWHNTRIIVGAGPYVSYLLSARDKYQSTTYTLGNGANNADGGSAARSTLATSGSSVVDNTNVIEGQRSIRVGNPDPNAPGESSLRTLDWGVNGFVGCELPGGLYAKLGTEVGLRNLQSTPDGSYAGKNLGFSLSVGYLIGYKR